MAKETRRIVSEGNLIRIERVLTEREVRLNDFVENINALEPLNTGVLPANCCYYGQTRRGRNQACRMYVILLPDHMQPVSYRPTRLERVSSTQRNRTHTLELSWPPSLWFFTFSNQSLDQIHTRTFTGDFIEQGESTPMHSLHMPNFNDSDAAGPMCVGSISVPMNLPFAKRLGLTMREILNTTWNDDLENNYEGTGVTDLLDWNEKSKDKPDFWKEMKFQRVAGRDAEQSSGETFGGLCSRLLRI